MINKSIDLTKNLQLRIKISSDMHIALRAPLPKLIRSTSLRNKFTEDALLVTLDHQGAISNLFHHKFWASGMALMRPTVECTLRGLWAKDFASDSDLEKEAAFQSKNDIADFCKQLKKRDDTKIIVEIVSNLMLAINSYAHGGFLQLKHRESGFSPEVLIDALHCVDTFALIAAHKLAEIHQNKELSINAHKFSIIIHEDEKFKKIFHPKYRLDPL